MDLVAPLGCLEVVELDNCIKVSPCSYIGLFILALISLKKMKIDNAEKSPEFSQGSIMIFLSEHRVVIDGGVCIL